MHDPLLNVSYFLVVLAVVCLVGGRCFFKYKAYKYRALLVAIAKEPVQPLKSTLTFNLSTEWKRTAQNALDAKYPDLETEAMVLQLTYQQITDDKEIFQNEED